MSHARVLDRYVFLELLPPFATGGGLFTFFLIIDRIYYLADLVITKGVPFHLVLQLLVYMLPSFLAHTLPMALLLAVLLVAGRMASDLEVVALKASGVSPLRLFAPFLAVAVLVTGVTAVLTLAVGPWSNTAFQRQLVRILQSRASAGVKERVFHTTFDQFVIYVEKVAASRVELRGLLVADERDPRLSRIITAEQGRFFSDGESGRTTLRLLDGTIHETDTDSPVRYRSTTFRLLDITLPVGDLPRVEEAEKDLGFRRLLATTVMRVRTGPSVAPFILDLHKRFALPIAAIVFAMVGFPLGIRARVGGKGAALVGSLVVAVTYYLLLAFLDRIANVRNLAPSVAVWTPPVLFGSIGLGLLWSSVAQIPVGRTKARWPLALSVRPRAPSLGPPVSRSRPLPFWRRRTSSHVIDRYLVREFLMYLGYGLGIGAALFVVVDLLLTLDLYLRLKPPLLYIVEHFFFRLPAALYEGFPIIVLVSTTLLFLRLSHDHELTALKAAGVSLYRVSLTILLSAVALSLGSLVFQETVLPILDAKGHEVDRLIILGEVPHPLPQQTHRWYRSPISGFIRAGLLDPVGQRMEEVSILQIDRKFHLHNRLDAARAHWTGEGWKVDWGIARKFGPDRSITEVPFGWMSLQFLDSPAAFTQSQQAPERMSFRELQTHLSELQAGGHQVGQHLILLYSKLAFPLIHVIMVLVAIPLALQWPHGGRVMGIALASVIAMGYWVINSLAIACAKADLVPPALAAWAANAVFAAIGASLFLRTRS